MHTLPIIAQSLPAPDKDFTWQALLFIVAMLSVVSTVSTIWMIFWGRNKPQKTQLENDPLVVTEAREYAPRKQVDALERKVDGNHTDLLNRLAALDETRRTSVSKVYDAMRASAAEARKEQREDLANLRTEMRADMRGLHDRLTEISEAIGAAKGELKRVPGHGADQTKGLY